MYLSVILGYTSTLTCSNNVINIKFIVKQVKVP